MTLLKPSNSFSFDRVIIPPHTTTNNQPTNKTQKLPEKKSMSTAFSPQFQAPFLLNLLSFRRPSIPWGSIQMVFNKRIQTTTEKIANKYLKLMRNYIVRLAYSQRKSMSGLRIVWFLQEEQKKNNKKWKTIMDNGSIVVFQSATFFSRIDFIEVFFFLLFCVSVDFNFGRVHKTQVFDTNRRLFFASSSSIWERAGKLFKCQGTMVENYFLLVFSAITDCLS